MKDEKLYQIWDDSVDADSVLEFIEECETILNDNLESVNNYEDEN